MSEEIENIISLTGGMNVEGEEEWESNEQVALKFKEGSLVGRVLARRHCTVNFFKTVFSRIWEKEGVYKKSTWIFYGEILITEKWPPNGNWKEASLNMVECWIKMKGFPPNALTLNNVKRLGNMLGEVSDIQWLNTNVMLMRDTVRVKIKFPTSKGAFVGRYIPNNGGQTWIQFKFESLPLLCFTCGHFGHEQMDSVDDVRDPANSLEVDSSRKLIAASQLHWFWFDF
ncbi:hypothetical protein G4B88_011781 [Cannabis sativa]|uniref:Zinc knuckle CX2CX4HX4C domain-containing protein n=1 Tax=Cannabis sativa TaxID=3483 RepID=A0A7J6DK84_CANSA|nr:hypothetical protein G4B88_011781 [Cannabis sativa]